MARYRSIPAQVADLRQAAGNGEIVAEPLVVEEAADDLEDLKKAELQERAEAAGLDTAGTKAELIERLRESSDE